MSWTRLFLLGDIGQQLDIEDVRHDVERMRAERDLVDWERRNTKDLADELLELELRHGLLVRLLIAKGVITAQEYATLIAAARPKPAPAEGAVDGE
jgi:hypothetical protein